MYEELLQEIQSRYPNKSVLTARDIIEFLECDEAVIKSWLKRTDPKRRPPKIKVGQEIRFPKAPFVRWLASEQGDGS